MALKQNKNLFCAGVAALLIILLVGFWSTRPSYDSFIKLPPSPMFMKRLSLEEIVARTQAYESFIETPQHVALKRDPAHAIMVSYWSGKGTFHVNPYTGEIIKKTASWFKRKPVQVIPMMGVDQFCLAAIHADPNWESMDMLFPRKAGNPVIVSIKNPGTSRSSQLKLRHNDGVVIDWKPAEGVKSGGN